MTDCGIYGLVLAGGFSKRMNSDKANLVYPGHGKPQWQVTAECIRPFCEEVFLSVRDGQRLDGIDEGSPETIGDHDSSQGPLSGFLSAMERMPGQALLVVACDLPLLNGSTLRKMIEHRGSADAIAYRSSSDGLPEPLCTLYEPAMLEVCRTAAHNGARCPRKILIQQEPSVKLLDLPIPNALDNATTPEDFARLCRVLDQMETV
jgi:molybdopterin-guanine dinucleotide biosynthesis protein A